MRQVSYWKILAVGGLSWLASSCLVWSDENPSSAMEISARKLGRGLMNVVSCPAELIRVPAIIGRKEGGLSATSVGIMQGAWRMIVRGVSGVYDVVTFPFPTPHSPIKPEFVWANGNWAE